MTNNTQQSAKKLITAQVVVAIVLVAIAFVINVHTGYSALLSAVICVFANWFFMKRFFRQTTARQVKQIMWDFYIGEIMKLVIIVALMLVAIILFHVRVLPFLLTYFILQISMLFAPMRQSPQGAQ